MNEGVNSKSISIAPGVWHKMYFAVEIALNHEGKVPKP
jgi:hypothetical protein